MKNENKAMQWFGHSFMILLSLACVIPFVLLLISSITSENEIVSNGYSFFPQELSMEAYKYLLGEGSDIFRSYGITILITVVGTSVSLVITSLLAYPISRKDYPLRNVLAFFVFFTLLFNGGLVPTYMIYSQMLDIKNTIWALIIPGLLMNGFNIMLMRTYFQTSIPMAVIESANIDGAGEIRTFASIVLPLSMPILATVGLFQTIAYWNDWMNGMVYITDPQYYSIQNLLNRILQDAQFMASGQFNSSGASASTEALPTMTVKMAIAVIGIIPILIAYPFFQKYFVKGITIGAVKG
ncbi:carbohydrate ABC transporter permease [Paenibacillus sp. LHD-38]|uniref:carbohydrate ABC transporter permease n=1 Tax=Paenibacillus sp. LHD-38 TaxID=3072143 RepID=UPI00280D92C5|nr:carbohydrate ABC transporter permease [Paenibacillus sp. LHD-38]MDQ8736500.1 carbohydrate ABC transporter permease [Paenibacillus sp. LHD-38]